MVITDEALNPFFIKVSEDSFDLVESVKSGVDSKTPGKIYDKNIGYFTNLSKALHKVAKIKVNRSDDIVTLNEYIKRVENINTKLSNLINI